MRRVRKGLQIPAAAAGILAKAIFRTRCCSLFCFSLYYWAIIAHNAPQNKKGACCACSERLLLRRERDSNPWNAKRSTVFETAPIDHSGISPKFHATTSVAAWVCGDRGIRTPEAFRLNGFQDRRYRPLSHISAAKVQKIDIVKSFLRKKICIKIGFVDNKLIISIV